ncbi:hypothetical protein CK203_076165 [Vitis vinifera]|uniref:Uncharacterized protein n=1 Tax=Vitis vinifera TaxID=29760 RepID=A0A438EEP0_VITVI|nr:hypothetical protein CK203_076165 [Vitis vinifera]
MKKRGKVNRISEMLKLLKERCQTEIRSYLSTEEDLEKLRTRPYLFCDQQSQDLHHSLNLGFSFQKYAKALADPKWKEAINERMKALCKNDTGH